MQNSLGKLAKFPKVPEKYPEKWPFFEPPVYKTPPHPTPDFLHQMYLIPYKKSVVSHYGFEPPSPLFDPFFDPPKWPFFPLGMCTLVSTPQLATSQYGESFNRRPYSTERVLHKLSNEIYTSTKHMFLFSLIRKIKL